jgi:hypothetical protein
VRLDRHDETGAVGEVDDPPVADDQLRQVLPVLLAPERHDVRLLQRPGLEAELRGGDRRADHRHRVALRQRRVRPDHRRDQCGESVRRQAGGADERLLQPSLDVGLAEQLDRARRRLPDGDGRWRVAFGDGALGALECLAGSFLGGGHRFLGFLLGRSASFTSIGRLCDGRLKCW